jgi:hypothetical protein
MAPVPMNHANQANVYAHTLDKNIACLPVTTMAHGQPDTAICTALGAQVLLWCVAGEGFGSNCLPLADFRPPPKKDEAPKTEAPKEETPKPEAPKAKK